MEISTEAVDKTLKNWCIVAIDRFQEALVKNDVGEIDGTLMRSFTYQVIKHDGDAWEVLIKFLQYGRFIDMGVGRGNPLDGGHGKRQPKKWYGKAKTKEVSILRFIMAKNYGILSLTKLETELKAIDKQS